MTSAAVTKVAKAFRDPPVAGISRELPTVDKHRTTSCADTQATYRDRIQKADAEALQAQADAEARACEARVTAAEALESHPGLLRMAELETLRDLAKNANARLYLGFDRNGLALDSEAGARGA